ncbi:MAG: histidine kinase [Candidatus Dormiibacterota bacterium]
MSTETSVQQPGPTRLSSSIAILLVVVYLVIAASVIALEWAVRNGPDPALVAPIVLSAYVLIGALIVVRRGSHPIGWILQAVGIVALITAVNEDYIGYALVIRPGSLPFGHAMVVVNSTIWEAAFLLFAVALPMLFPNGRLLSRRWAVVYVFAVIFVVLAFVGNALVPGPTTKYSGVTNPIGVPSLRPVAETIQNLAILPGLATLIGVVASVVVRFRRSRGAERQQLKWFFFAALLIPVNFILNGTPVAGVAYLTILPLVAVAIGLAILRYRLYDIDVVISRTLVYGSLAAFITAVYVGIVVGIGTLVGSGGKPNLVLSIVATAIVAVAFQPVRERLQKIANRLVYGKRATPYEVLSQFSERVAETYAAEEALPRMARVLAEGTGAERAQVWLRAGSILHPAATWPEANGSTPSSQSITVQGQLLPELPADQAVPVRHQGELLGALTVSKRQGESLTPIEQKLLDDLAHQAGLVLKNVGLTAELLQRLEELRASRQRLVAAQDDERRRLERNLHDGAQQNLVALKVKLGLAEMLAEKDPDRVKQLLAELKGDTDEALETLRDLARGIYPPLLADKGLTAALEAQARKATVPVEVDAGGVGRFPQDIEAAVYFCVLEALQNVQKYAGAGKARVRLREEDGALTFEVVDDGKGFDPATQKKGSGTQNMEDRLDALGGSVKLESAPGQGTSIRGSLPLGVPVPA